MINIGTVFKSILCFIFLGIFLTGCKSVNAGKIQNTGKVVQLKPVCECDCVVPNDIPGVEPKFIVVQFDATNSENCSSHNKKKCEVEDGDGTLADCEKIFVRK